MWVFCFEKGEGGKFCWCGGNGMPEGMEIWKERFRETHQVPTETMRNVPTAQFAATKGSKKRTKHMSVHIA